MMSFVFEIVSYFDLIFLISFDCQCWGNLPELHVVLANFESEKSSSYIILKIIVEEV